MQPALLRAPAHADFHRQKPIDEYIVDFFRLDLMLAIEIDGGRHDHKRSHDCGTMPLFTVSS